MLSLPQSTVVFQHRNSANAPYAWIQEAFIRPLAAPCQFYPRIWKSVTARLQHTKAILVFFFMVSTHRLLATPYAIASVQGRHNNPDPSMLLQTHEHQAFKQPKKDDLRECIAEQK